MKMAATLNFILFCWYKTKSIWNDVCNGKTPSKVFPFFPPRQCWFLLLLLFLYAKLFFWFLQNYKRNKAEKSVRTVVMLAVDLSILESTFVCLFNNSILSHCNYLKPELYIVENKKVFFLEFSNLIGKLCVQLLTCSLYFGAEVCYLPEYGIPLLLIFNIKVCFTLSQFSNSL